MDFVTDVALCLRQYCRGESRRTAIERLVRLSAKIARQRLWGKLRAASMAQETTVELQSMSVVEALFTKSGSDSQLAAALVDVLDSDDITLFQRFQAVVVRTASQELFHRWDESDPLSARLWKNLQRALRYDPRLLRFPQVKPAWVILSSDCSADSDLVQLSWDEIKAHVDNWRRPDAALADLVVAILSNTKPDSGQTHVVSIEMLFAALRDARTETISEELSRSIETTATDPLLQAAIDRAKQATRRDTEVKFARYLSSGKLCCDAVKHFRSALWDLLEDCADGGPAMSHYKYLSIHWSDLDYDDYRKAYRTRFEYLAEYVQERFAMKLRENYVP